MGRFFVFITILCVLAPTPAHALVTIRVNTTKDVVADDGHCSLREAINAATTNLPTGAKNGECVAGDALVPDTIVLKRDDVYALTMQGSDDDANASGDLDITSNVVIKGAGKATIKQTTTDRVVDVLSGDVATLQHVRIIGGHTRYGDGLAPNQDGEPGGGVRNAGTLTLQYVKVIGNRTGDGVTRSDQSFNGAGGKGGGIYNGGTLMLNNSVVSRNHAGAGGSIPFATSPVVGAGIGGDGGGIFNNSSLTVTGSTISANSAGTGGQGQPGPSPGYGGYGGAGGGIYNASTATITATRIVSNRGGTGGTGGENLSTGTSPPAPGGFGGSGGGLFDAGTTTNVHTTTISSNHAGTGGRGGIGSFNGSANPGGTGGQGGEGGSGGGTWTDASEALVESTVSGNFGGLGGPGGPGGPGNPQGATGPVGAAADGGGIFTFGNRALQATNDTISGNSSRASGGGIESDGYVLLNNVTIAFNTAATSAGGVEKSGGTFALSNTIIGDNTAPNDPDCSGVSSGGYFNLIEDPTGCLPYPVGNDQNAADPRLGSLANNGGPTKTHALKAGSPAINHGNPSPGAGACETNDQRGKPRVGTCDIGAYERQ